MRQWTRLGEIVVSHNLGLMERRFLVPSGLELISPIRVRRFVFPFRHWHLFRMLIQNVTGDY
jgi:hypothetical protein